MLIILGVKYCLTAIHSVSYNSKRTRLGAILFCSKINYICAEKQFIKYEIWSDLFLNSTTSSVYRSEKNSVANYFFS